MRYAGPLFTPPGGYPTQSWGKDGYGLELDAAPAARAAVARLAGEGARFIKLAFDARTAQLDAQVAREAVEEAHQRGLQVAAHALDEGSVRRALDAGVDILAHAPVEPLPTGLVQQIGGRKLWVISTLQACGGSTGALENLRALRAAGARIVYGTDLGNEGTAPGIDARELALLARAGLSPLEILRAATSAPAALLDEPDLGRLTPGAAASLLALRRDPRQDPQALVAPAWVMIDGALPQ